MAIDHKAKAERLARREAALARAARAARVQALNHGTKYLKPQTGIYADVDRKKALPCSNKNLQKVILWKNTRKPPRKSNWEGKRINGMAVKMNRRDSGADMELDDSKMDELVGVKKVCNMEDKGVHKVGGAGKKKEMP